MPRKAPIAPARAAALIAAATLVATAATALGGAAPTTDYRFGWGENAFPYTSATDTTAEGEEESLGFRLDFSNLTVVRFLLTWQDDVGAPDTLRLTVVDPSGREWGPANATADSNGVVELTARIAEVPPGTVTVRASDEREAWDVLLAGYPGANDGRGTWTVFVAVEHAGDGPGDPLGLTREPDASEDWVLDVDVARYEARIVERKAVAAPEVPAEPNPTEMPPAEEPPAEEPDLPATGTTEGGVLATRGAQSLLLVGAAAAGVGVAVALARRAGKAA